MRSSDSGEKFVGDGALVLGAARAHRREWRTAEDHPTFDAAVIELELAANLEAAGDSDDAAGLRASSERSFASVGCLRWL